MAATQGAKWIIVITFLLVLTLISISHCAGVKRETYVRVLRTNCTGNFEILTIDQCELKRIKRKHGSFSYAVTLNRPVEQPMLSLAALYQKPEETKPTLRFTDINLCNIAASNVDKILELLPFAKKILDQVVRTCPFQGHISVENLIIDYFDETLLRTLSPTGNYILKLNFIDGLRKQMFFQVHVVVHFNGLFSI